MAWLQVCASSTTAQTVNHFMSRAEINIEMRCQRGIGNILAKCGTFPLSLTDLLILSRQYFANYGGKGRVQKKNRKKYGLLPKLIQPGSDAKSDSSSQKRKAFKPKQGKHFLDIYFDPLNRVDDQSGSNYTENQIFNPVQYLVEIVT